MNFLANLIRESKGSKTLIHRCTHVSKSNSTCFGIHIKAIVKANHGDYYFRILSGLMTYITGEEANHHHQNEIIMKSIKPQFFRS